MRDKSYGLSDKVGYIHVNGNEFEFFKVLQPKTSDRFDIVCTVSVPDSVTRSPVSIAKQHHNDKFCLETGLRIAMARALDCYGISRKRKVDLIESLVRVHGEEA